MSFRNSRSSGIEDETRFNEETAKKYVNELDQLDSQWYFENPKRICNLDESGFKLGTDGSVVVVKKGRIKKVTKPSKGKLPFLSFTVELIKT